MFALNPGVESSGWVGDQSFIEVYSAINIIICRRRKTSGYLGGNKREIKPGTIGRWVEFNLNIPVC